MDFPKCTIPEGSSGDWRVEKFSVTKDEIKIFNMRCMFQPGGASRMMIPGDYTKLTRNGIVVMSDTPAELRDHWEPVWKASGNCLINGLGLGIILAACLAKDDVESVTVIEKSSDVIALTAPHFDDHRVKIIQADAYTWQPPKSQRYNIVWHDIWDYICGDNLPEMTKLHRKYGRRADWQGSWCKNECKS